MYDAGDRRTSVADSLGATTTRASDAMDRLTRRGVSGVNSPLHVELTWTDCGELATLSRYTDSGGSTLAGTTSYTYDDTARLKEVWHRDGSANVLASYVYGVDSKGRASSETINGAINTFSYDSADQLIADGANTYGYDSTGNRTNAGYSTGGANQLSGDGVWTYTYDDKGQLTKKSKGASAETWVCGYDHRG